MKSILRSIIIILSLSTILIGCSSRKLSNSSDKPSSYEVEKTSTDTLYGTYDIE